MLWFAGSVSSLELGESVLGSRELGRIRQETMFVGTLTAVTFLTLLAVIPRSPPCFDSIAASFTNLELMSAGN